MSDTKIIRDGVIVADDWVLLPTGYDAAFPSGKLIVPLNIFVSRQAELTARTECTGVWMEGHDDLTPISNLIEGLPLIAIHFPKFTDGRGYSTAVLLRTRYSFKGELRATGEVLRDQLFYLRRVGFNAFAVRADKDIVDALKALTDFSESYQASTDQPVPLFRRRATHAPGSAA